jgi:hypothetical protein
LSLTNADIASEQAQRLARTYKKIGAAYHLTRVADPNGNAANVSFNPPGNAA